MTRALTLLLLFSLSLARAAAEPAQSPDDVLREIQTRCSRVPGSVGSRVLCGGGILHAFYERRGFRPAWFDAAGSVLPAASSLVRALESAPEHGLKADDYHLAAIRSSLRSWGKGSAARDQADLDLLLSDAFLLYGAHLLGGRVDPLTLHPDWIANPRTADVAAVLERAVGSGRIEAELAGLAPAHPEYRQLREALAGLRRVEASGGWPRVPPGPALRRGSHGPRVEALRRRLAPEEDGAVSAAPDLGSFDADLGRALAAFQARHGLRPDAVAGRATLTALNAAVEGRIRQVEVNLERWRWLPQSLGERHIRVNIAGFGLEVREGEAVVLASAVVVGKPFTRTPVFSSKLTQVVLNPTWNVPESIGRKEILADAQKDPKYLLANGFRVFRGSRRDAQELDPSSVEWASLSPETLDLRFSQSPGPANALGRIKFLLPNRFDVYLHDTPSKGLFALPKRAFSHGCIRVEKAQALAEYLLRDQPDGSPAALKAALARGTERTVRVRQSVPVHVLYQTAWVEREGTLHFGEDVYGRDEPLARALTAASPVK